MVTSAVPHPEVNVQVAATPSLEGHSHLRCDRSQIHSSCSGVTKQSHFVVSMQVLEEAFLLGCWQVYAVGLSEVPKQRKCQQELERSSRRSKDHFGLTVGAL